MLGPRARKGRPWNVNIHYDATLDACVSATAGAVLDVGCGDGFLAARLARRVPHVTGLDADGPVLGRARARFPDSPVTWCHGDVMTHPFEPASFDAVVSNAALHHLPDTRAALERLASLVRPGGTLAVVGFARPALRDVPWAVTAFVVRNTVTGVAGKWEHTATVVWPPRDTVRDLRRAAAETLPGARLRLLILGRYLLTWTRPADGQPS